ncbi:MAG TPA: hypothetical protein VIG48_03875 [Jatrophihabitans sp.]|jgi:hypothetical protein
MSVISEPVGASAAKVIEVGPSSTDRTPRATQSFVPTDVAPPKPDGTVNCSRPTMRTTESGGSIVTVT